MKRRPLFSVGFVAISFLGQAAFSQSASLSGEEQSKLDGITQRVRSGDYKALFEASTFPPEIAVPYISSWGQNDLSPRPPKDAFIGAALKKAPGAIEYIKRDIAGSSPSSGGLVPWYAFDTLSLMSTPEAEAVIAPYLFDLEMRTPPGATDPKDSNCGTTLTDANCDGAVLSLERMNLWDAPYGEYSPTDNSVILIAWQRWAIAKGFVPKAWSAKVKAPDWMLNVEKFEGIGVLPGRSPTVPK